MSSLTIALIERSDCMPWLWEMYHAEVSFEVKKAAIYRIHVLTVRRTK